MINMEKMDYLDKMIVLIEIDATTMMTLTLDLYSGHPMKCLENFSALIHHLLIYLVTVSIYFLYTQFFFIEFSLKNFFFSTDLGYGRRDGNRHSHPQNNTLLTSFMNPFMGVSLMDDYFGQAPANNGFTSISSMSFSNAPGNSNMKRTSTSTTFVNGKKLMTRKYVHLFSINSIVFDLLFAQKKF